MAIETTRTDGAGGADIAAGALTERGRACIALIRFERPFEALEGADRAWFADELAGLAAEARDAR